MSFEKRVAFEEERTLGFAAIGVAFVVVGVPLANPIRLINLANQTDQPMIFSFDGVTDHINVGNGNSAQFFSSDYSSSEETAVFAQGSSIFVRHPGLAPAAGSVFINAGFVE